MRKTILVLVLLVLVWIGYLAWPLYDLFKLARAIEERNIEAAAERIDFVRVRASFTRQVVETYLEQTGARVSPLLQGGAISIADPVVAKFVSPETLAELLRVGWPVAALPNRPHDAAGISIAALGTLWQVFSASDYGLGRYEVTVPVTLPPERAFGLSFHLVNWRWRLSDVRLPQPIRVLLAEELVRFARPPSP